MATIPERAGTLAAVIERIAPQFDQVNVFLDGHGTVPRCLWGRRNVRWLRGGELGLGDAGKFYWSSEVDGLHFVLDDDILYPPDYGDVLAGELERLPGAIVGVHGARFTFPIRSYYRSRRVWHYARRAPALRVHVLGTGTVAYDAREVPISLHDFHDRDMADIFLALAAESRGVPRWLVPRADNWLRSLPDGGVSIWNRCKDRDERQTAWVRATSWRRI